MLDIYIYTYLCVLSSNLTKTCYVSLYMLSIPPLHKPTLFIYSFTSREFWVAAGVRRKV